MQEDTEIENIETAMSQVLDGMIKKIIEKEIKKKIVSEAVNSIN